MQEQADPFDVLDLPGVVPSKPPEVLCWSTSTELGGTDRERKTYFLTIMDGDRRVQFSLQHFPAENRIVAEPYSPPDYDYTQYDNWDEEDEDEEDDWYGYESDAGDDDELDDEEEEDEEE